MSDIAFAYKPTIVIAKVTREFTDCGFSSSNIVVIRKINEGAWQTYDPTLSASSINGFEKDEAYLFISKIDLDLTGLAFNTLPDNYETEAGNNVFANKWFAGIARQTADFTTVGFTTSNLKIIYRIDSPYESYDPNEAASAISGFEEGQCYLGYALADQDISDYLIPPVIIKDDITRATDEFKYFGTTDLVDGAGATIKDFYNIPVRFFDDEASLPATGTENIEYIAKEEKTSWYWDGAAYQQIGSSGGTSGIDDVLAVGQALTAGRTIDGDGNYLAFTDGRIEFSKGADVASANDLTLGNNGNAFNITGTTQINAITTANWQAGSFVFLIFGNSITVKHNTAGGAGTAKIFLSNSIDFSAISNDCLLLFYDGTQWQEIARKNAGTSGGINDVLAKAQNFTANRAINTLGFGLTIQATGATTALTISSIAGGTLSVSSSTGLPGIFIKNPSSTNTIEDVVTVRRQTSGTPANGIGLRINAQLERSGSSASDAGNISFVFDDASSTPHSSVRLNTNDVEVLKMSGRTVTTTDATPTTLQTQSITDETIGLIEVFIAGKSSGTSGKITGKKIVGYRKDGGTLTLDSLTTVLADVVTGDLSTATWTISTSSNNIIIQVTGEAAKNINWKCVLNQIDI